jgi:hypothetical protein
MVSGNSLVQLYDAIEGKLTNDQWARLYKHQHSAHSIFNKQILFLIGGYTKKEWTVKCEMIKLEERVS